MNLFFWKKRKEVTGIPGIEGRPLKLTWQAISEFQELTGTDILQIGDIRKLTPKETYILIWKCLTRDDPALTFTDVSAMIERADMQALWKSLIDCINESLPEVKGETVPLAVTQSQPTGPSSGPLPSTTSKSPKCLSWH